MDQTISRRRFLTSAASLGAFALAPVALADAAEAAGSGSAEDVAPAEDLMREHGVLNRILLIYDRFAESLEVGSEDGLSSLRSAAELLKRFIEDYHEKLEEEHLFPRFAKTGLAAEVDVLKTQHEAGRRLTAKILELSALKALGDARQKELRSALAAFTRMYRPHEAREDTVIFPAFKKLVTRAEYWELGERFEDEERRLFPKGGFESVVEQVAALEKPLGLYELKRFTP